MNRGIEAAQSFTSPLAQIFQPLVVDDDMPVANEQSHDAPLISYGPTTRRRVMSMQGAGHRRGTSDLGGGRLDSGSLSPASHPQPQNRHAQRSPHGFASMDEVMSGVDGVLSDSPGNARGSSSDIPTVGQIEEEEGNDGGPQQWTEKLQKMEERQERIEKLLESIAKDLNESRNM